MSHLQFGQSEDDWHYFHNITIHNVDDSMPWPQPVRHLAQFFDAPLPGWLVTGPHPFVSEDASDLLCEVSRQSVEDSSILLDYSCTDPSAHPIGKAFDLIASSVAILRQIKSREIPGEHRITTPLWTSLISGVSHVCMPDCVPIGETRFALPRVAHPESHPFVQLEAQEGLATLLISYIGEITPSAAREECDLQSECVDYRTSFDSDTEAEPRESLQEEDEEEDDDSPDPFYNAHVLEPLSDSAVIIPIICVAYPEEVIPLLASVLYQRWVWDIVEPVIGITFPKTGTVGKVIFAWLGPTDNSQVDLPIVNISIGYCQNVDHRYGIYDLSNAVSALRLSSFLLSLSEHSSKVRSATDQQRRMDESDLVRKSWRADLVEKPLAGSWEDRETTIDMWRQAVADSSLDSITIPCSSPDVEMPPKSGRNTGIESSTRIQIIDTNSQTGSSAESANSLKFYSCSSYAALDDKGIVDNSSMTNWLMERRALPIACIEGENEEIDKMIKLYNDYTELRWPAEWTSEDKLPPVDAGVDSLRKTLFLLGKECGVPLSRSISRMIRHRLSSLLWAADDTSSRHVRAQNTGALEADRRHDWDSLVLHFYRQKDDVGIDVLLERTLRLARNPYHDSMRGDINNRKTVDESLLDVVKLYRDQCEVDKQKAAGLFESAGDALDQKGVTHGAAELDRLQDELRRATNVHKQATAASTEATHHFTDLSIRSRTERQDFLKSLETRSIKEPHTGRCDAIGVVGIPKFLDNLPAGRFFGNELSLVMQPEADSSVSDLVNQLQKTGIADPEEKPYNLRSQPKKSEKGKSQDAESNVNKEDTGIFRSVELRSLAPEGPKNSSVRYEDLQLPALLVEHKKLDIDKVLQATNQSKQYSVSAVTFLNKIGICDIPVFGLVTDGPIGVVSCTWYSSERNCIYVMERNGRAFDIRTPLGAYHCATFFATLATKHVPELRTKYSEAAAIYKGPQNDEEQQNMMWIKAKQCEQYNLHPKLESKVPSEVSPLLTD